MKLFKKIRKGFTLIELVVVIAVIAILAAVSVVSYVAITNRAKQSADEQAVRQMNTILSANSVMDLRSINDVFAAFAENQLDAENYKPLYKDRYFFWDSETNQVVYTDKNYVVIYPESLKGQSKGTHQWYSLTQSLIKTDIKSTDTVTVKDAQGNTVAGLESAKVREITPATTTTAAKYDYAVATPEQLYTIGQELKDAILTPAPKGQSKVLDSGIKVETVYNSAGNPNVTYIVGDVTIDLAQDLDLMGAAFNFCVKGNFTLNGHGHKITGIVNNKDFVVGASKTVDGTSQPERYGTGIIGYINKPSTGRGSATFTDVTIENCVFGYSEGKGSGLIGYAADSNVEFENVKMVNCVSEGYEHSVGGFIGDIQSNVQVTLKGANEVKNTVLKLHQSGDGVTEANKECYGAGYFIGRQTKKLVTVTGSTPDADSSTEGKGVQGSGSFAQSGNSKIYDPARKFASGSDGETQKGYFYWDDAVLANRKHTDQ